MAEFVAIPRLPLVDTLPVSGVEGDLVILSTDDLIYYHDGTDWVALAVGAGVTFAAPQPSIQGDSEFEGVSTDSARADHQHSRNTDWRWYWAEVGP